MYIIIYIKSLKKYYLIMRACKNTLFFENVNFLKNFFFANIWEHNKNK